MAELTGARLLLRPFRLSDESAVHRYAADPAVTQYTDWGPNTPAETAAFIRSAVAPAPSSHPFAIVLPAEQILIGAAELRVVSEREQRGELGYVLARRWWGLGYATEAAGLLLEFGFGSLGLRRIEATCDPENVASVRVLTKIGLSRIGLLGEHLLVRGVWRDSLLFAMDAEDRKNF
jgi:ribosomal-protein-alanine N-acetyltransferase